VAESGVPGYEAGTWFALAGPAGMPREVTYAIYNEVKKVLNEPAFKEKYIDKQWFEVVTNTPDDFAAFLQTDYERWEKLIRLSGVKAE
jgi:tripartite-type tricarboxylate transporter receptor subunit TctC